MHVCVLVYILTYVTVLFCYFLFLNQHKYGNKLDHIIYSRLEQKGVTLTKRVKQKQKLNNSNNNKKKIIMMARKTPLQTRIYKNNKIQ